MTQAGLAAGLNVKVRQGNAEAVLQVAIDDTLPANCVRVAAAHGASAGLGPMFGTLTLEKA